MGGESRSRSTEAGCSGKGMQCQLTHTGTVKAVTICPWSQWPHTGDSSGDYSRPSLVMHVACKIFSGSILLPNYSLAIQAVSYNSSLRLSKTLPESHALDPSLCSSTAMPDHVMPEWAAITEQEPSPLAPNYLALEKHINHIMSPTRTNGST